MNESFQIQNKFISIIIISLIILTSFLVLFVISVEKVHSVAGQDLIITSDYIVSGNETWDNVWVKNHGILIIPNNTILNALNIYLESGSKFEINGGRISLINNDPGSQVKFIGLCDSFICRNGSSIVLTAPYGSTLLSN